MYKMNLHYVDYEQLKNNLKKGLRNFKIPGSPSGTYSSDFGSLKIILTSPPKKYILLFFFLHKIR